MKKIVGHKDIWQSLKKIPEAGRLSHTFLFFGPEKVGKTTLALEFIKFLNCKSQGEKPCGLCRSCLDFEKKSHPDFTFIEPDKKEIKISQIRELTWHLSLQPSLASFKSAIIDDAHTMNEDAQNCLLKTLEEPKGKAVIILITAFPELLLSTIASRTKKIRFSSVSKDELGVFLKEKGLSKKELDKLTSISLGRPGEIIDFLDDPKLLEDKEKIIKELERLFDSPLAFRFQYAKKISDDRKRLNEILNIWLRYFREKLISLLKYPEKETEIKKLKKIASLIQDIQFLLSKTEVNPKLAVETLLLEF